jgi:hypothetical protein
MARPWRARPRLQAAVVLLTPEQESARLLRRFAVGVGCGVRVEGEDEPWRRVPEPVLGGPDVDTGRDPRGCGGVAKGVERESRAGKAHAFQRRKPDPLHEVRASSKGFGQLGHERRRHGDGSDAGSRLRLADHDCAANLGDRPPDGDSASEEIEITDLQSRTLTETQPQLRREVDHLAVLHADCFREAMDVVDGDRSRRLGPGGRKLDPAAGRPRDEVSVHGSVEDRAQERVVSPDGVRRVALCEIVHEPLHIERSQLRATADRTPAGGGPGARRLPWRVSSLVSRPGWPARCRPFGK